MDLGGRVRTKRRELKLSQDALARRADVSLSLINQMERGLITDPHYSTLRNISMALDMNVSELVEEESSCPKVEAPSPPPETSEGERREEEIKERLEEELKERREKEIEDLSFDELVALYQELTEQRDEVARALVRKGPYTETPLSAKQRDRRESEASEPSADDVHGAAEAG